MSMIGAEVQFHSCPGKSRSSWSHSFTTILNPLHCCLKNPRQAHGRNELDFCFHKVRYRLCSHLYHRHQPSVRHGMEAWNGAMAKYIESIFPSVPICSPTALISYLLPPQARNLPPYGLLMAILDKSALKMVERGQLRNGTQEKLTPFAAKAFEAQRYKSST